MLQGSKSITEEAICTNDKPICCWMFWDCSYQRKCGKLRVKMLCPRVNDTRLFPCVRLVYFIAVWFAINGNTAPINTLFNFLMLMFKHSNVIIILLISIYSTPMTVGKLPSLSISTLVRLVQINLARSKMNDDDDDDKDCAARYIQIK